MYPARHCDDPATENADHGSGARRHRRKDWLRGLAHGRLLPMLLVAQLSSSVGQENLMRMLSQADHVRDVQMVSDRPTNRHGGTAYVQFDSAVKLEAATRMSKAVLVVCLSQYVHRMTGDVKAGVAETSGMERGAEQRKVVK